MGQIGIRTEREPRRDHQLTDRQRDRYRWLAVPMM
jgi:hypothetical protein